jgi:hypothetical protein
VKPGETASQRVQETRDWGAKHIKHFDAILSRFERKLGADVIDFEVLDYATQFGIAVKELTGRRIAIKFDKHSGIEECNAAIDYAQRFLDGKTEYKGISPDWLLMGNEISARSILSGETK